MKIARETYGCKNFGHKMRNFYILMQMIMKSALLVTGKVCANRYFLFLNVLVFREGFYTVANFKMFLVENTYLILLL